MAKYKGKKLLDKYKSLMRNPKFQELARDFDLDPKSEDFAEVLGVVVERYNEIIASEKDNGQKVEKSDTEQELENNNNTEQELENNNNAEPEPENKNNAKPKPEEKNDTSKKKEKKQIHLPDETWKKYKGLMNNKMFRKMAEEAGLDVKSYTKAEDFIADLDKLEKQYYINVDKKVYDKLMQNEDFKAIATKLGVDPKADNFATTLNKAKRKYYSLQERKAIEEDNDSMPKNSEDKSNWTWDNVIKEPTTEELKSNTELDVEIIRPETRWTMSNGLIGEIIDAEFSSASTQKNSDKDGNNKSIEEELIDIFAKQGMKLDLKGVEIDKDFDINAFRDAFYKAQRVSQTRNSQGPSPADLKAFYNEALNNYMQKTREFDINFEKARQEHKRKLEIVDTEKKTEDQEIEELFNQIINSDDIVTRFDAKEGKYQLFMNLEEEHKIYETEPVKMSARERRKFAKDIDRKYSYLFHAKVGKYIDPNIYNLLGNCDALFRENKRSLVDAYVKSVARAKNSNEKGKDTLLNEIEYDLRGIKNQKNIKASEKRRIEKFAKQHEEMELAEVKRDPKLKSKVKKWVVGLATTGLALFGGIMLLPDKTEAPETSKVIDFDKRNKDQIPKKDNDKDADKNNEDDKSEQNTTDNGKGDTKQDTNNTQSNVNNAKEEIPASEKEDLVIGKEVTVSAEKLYHSCEYASPTCNMSKFMQNNPDAKFILSRVAVKTVNGYPVNTTLDNTSLEELKEKYGEDGVEYWCNFKVEVPGGTYIDIGWANEKDVQVKEEFVKENPWQLDEAYVKATNEAGRSGVSKGTENTIKDTLKDIGIEADF